MTANLLASLPLWLNSTLLVVAALIIAKGAQVAIASASQLATSLGLSELVIGLTVVALGTSLPEFAVTVTAALEEQGNISLGNIVGSNNFNLGFILGGCALIRSIPTNNTLVRRDGPILVAASLLLLLFVGTDLTLSRFEAGVMLLILLSYLGHLIHTQDRTMMAEAQASRPAGQHPTSTVPRLCLTFGFGLVLVLAGSQLMVDSAVTIATRFGISDWVIAVTIVAAGTSMPELATSLAGVIRGHYSLSAGNLIGSDLFNILGVLGLAGMIHPISTDPMARLSLLAVIVMVIVALIFMRSGWRISRIEGALLIALALFRWGLDTVSRSPAY